MYNVEKFLELVEQFEKDNDIDGNVCAWNDICSRMETDDTYIFENNTRELLNMTGNDFDEVLRAVCYGDYGYMDLYCYIDAYGNFKSFSYWAEFDEGTIKGLVEDLFYHEDEDEIDKIIEELADIFDINLDDIKEDNDEDEEESEDE